MILVSHLSKHYQTDLGLTKALDDVSFTIEDGSSLAICGASGAGKSTLLSLIGGLDEPTSGSVTIENQNLFLLSPKELARFRNRYLGFVFQFHYLLSDFNVIENVMMPLLIGGVSEATAKNEALIMLEKVGVAALAARFTQGLSGGEQQRVAIARALVHKPKLILADEPTGNLDDENSTVVFDLLCRLNHDLGSTLIVVTHHADFAKKMSRVLRLEKGHNK